MLKNSPEEWRSGYTHGKSDGEVAVRARRTSALTPEVLLTRQEKFWILRAQLTLLEALVLSDLSICQSYDSVTGISLIK